MSKKSIIIIVIVAVVVAISAAIYFTIKAAKAKQQNGGNDKFKNVPTETTVFPLTIGSKGKAVKAVQLKTGVTVDGIFGDQTKGGVLSYFGSSLPTVSKEKFVELLTIDNGDASDFDSYYAQSDSYFRQFATVMAGSDPGTITYDEYIALAQKVFGLTPSDFKQ